MRGDSLNGTFAPIINDMYRSTRVEP